MSENLSLCYAVHFTSELFNSLGIVILVWHYLHLPFAFSAACEGTPVGNRRAVKEEEDEKHWNSRRIM